MRRQKSLIISAALSSLLVSGCKPSPHVAKAVDAAFGKVNLGMPIDDAKALVDGKSELRTYDGLPADPKPRQIYFKLPSNTEWYVWADAGKPTLVVGVVGGKVVFKQVLWKDGGEFKSDTIALPEYQ